MRATNAPAIPAMGGSVMARTTSGAELQRARNRQRQIGKIVRDAAAHVVARISGRADALDADAVANLAAQETQG